MRLNSRLLYFGAVAAVTGGLAQLVAALLEPDWGGSADEAIRVVSASGIWIGDRLLDLIGVLLTVGALAVVTRTFAAGSGRDWARVGQPLLVLMGALGSGAVLTGATMKDVADSWAGAAPAAQQSYLAAFDAMTSLTEALFFGAFLALGAYLATLAAAILVGGVYARWIGWASATAAALISGGTLLQLVNEVSFVAVLAGFVVFVVVVIALGVTMWRYARAAGSSVAKHRAAPAQVQA